MDTVNINVYQKTIEFIANKMGFAVLQIFPLNDSTAYYFLVHEFHVSTRTPTDDIQFNQLVGINITDIVRNNSTIDKRQFELKLNEFINGADVIRAEFPSTMRWFKFASANK